MKISTKLTLIMFGFAALSACDSDSTGDFTPIPIVPAPPPTMQEFEVDIVNLTNAQILSPIALISHDSTYRIFSIGETASLGLEILAEGGDNAELLSEATADSAVSQALSSAGPVMPGATETISIAIRATSVPDTQLSFVTMLINTNDAITAAHAMRLGNMDIGDAFSMTTISYDSGTEADTEELGTIPGPADSGEGFNPARDDIMDTIRGHSGVVTSDDGLATSILNQNHRWDNPVARVTVRRVL